MTQDPITEGERRLVTVLFADLVGYTTASESQDPELIQETLNLCFGRLGDEIRRYGGFVDKVIGDSIMALFGAPRAQEDDAGKAIAAGLAMQRALEELMPAVEARLGAPFHLRIGINTGLVVTGAVGPGGYTVTGDAVNVASRLESNAPQGGVLVGETSRRLARRQFRWGERRELQVKGRTEPVICYVAEAPGAALLRLVPAPSDTPYVGRNDLLQSLHDLWIDDAHAERVVELVGEAGIGKTRLLAHFFAVEGVTAEQVIYTRADTPPRTFGPLLQLFPSIAGDLPAALRRQIEALAEPDDLPAGADLAPDWLVDGLVQVISALAERAPLALVLDDMHRADQATIGVVEKVLPRLASMPVLVLLLRQPHGRRPRRLPMVASITLEPLTDTQATELVRAAAPSLSDMHVTAIVSRTGGNPLYLEMLASAYARMTEGEDVPASLQTAIIARIDDLDETSRAVLREASIFGHSFLEEPLKLITSAPAGMYESLAHLCEVGLIDEQPRVNGRGYAFRHSLVQQVLIEGMLRARRQSLHLAAAEALELVQEEGIEVEPEQIAYHFEQAGDAQRAATYHLASAERADRMGARSEARQHRRTANRLLSLTSLADLYGSPARPSLAGRGAAAATQIVLALALVLPVFLLLSTQRPRSEAITLGLPLDIVEFNPSSVLIAVAIGGLPLLLGGVVFSHLAAPALMRRHVGVTSMVLAIAGGWLLALLSVLAGFTAMIALLRYGALDRLSSIYVGAAMLQMLLGDHSLIIATVAGTLLTAIAWTLLLRLQAAGWARQRRPSVSPRQLEAGRRLAAVRQLGLLLAAAGMASVIGLAAYQFGLFPESDLQSGFGGALGGTLFAVFAGVAAAGGALGLRARQKLRREAPDYRPGMFGFEVPLLCALAFGLVIWFGMRQAVIASANDVDTPGSVAPFDRAVRLFPDLGLAYYLRGERYLAAGDFERAASDFDRAIALDPEFPASYLARGRVRVDLGDLDGAVSDANRLVELQPEHPGGYAIRAWARAEQGDLAAAAEDLELATRPLSPDARGWDAYFIRCITLTATDRYEEAEPDCLRVLELNPGHIVSLDQLAFISFQSGEYDQGIDYTTRILDIEPDNVQALANRGQAYQLTKRFDEAEADLSRAIELDPNHVLARQSRAVVRLYADRAEDAMEDANVAVSLDSGQRNTRLFVARYSGEYALAVEDATELLRVTIPPTPFLLSARGLAYLELGDLDRGLDDINEALRVDPEYAAGYDRRGYGHYLRNEYAQADADFDEALRRLSALPPQGRAELHYHRALLLMAEGDRDAAIREVDEAASLVEIPGVRRQIEELRASVARN